MSNYDQKDPGNVARGLKAAINNPNVSEEAKQRDIQKLQEMGYDAPGGNSGSSNDAGDHDGLSTRQRAGYKATLKNDNVSEEAKQHAREVLGQESGNSGGTQNTRVLAGYKATLSNPRTSEAAKQHAAEVLEENGA
ncbi:hypothetical protein CC1G_06942 [Coprinopsis cinerea okayama7|uniref:Conidiation protein 6 n=1 Tax=Coprinopsis cinerea (strain Okayama-7 / 130 / ATCC MYA-4618 / FGSC 9003) TaxID=240176 RepID=A8NZS3_COPC7|nr:hypothetical protein CC1G_06942 [Coprinopsis cinerea okayama7\|eukprot:XP_001837736.1 hypothetical protein CC1G_06942 [Coprinopsis cinerea okayama7\